MSGDASRIGGTVFPAFKHDDGPTAIDFPKTAFGFEPGLVVPGPDGTVAHAELEISGGGVMLGSKQPPDAENVWTEALFGVYVVVDDVEAHYARAKTAGATIVRPLADTDYGSREYSALDHEGNPWSFGTYRPGDATG